MLVASAEITIMKTEIHLLQNTPNTSKKEWKCNTEESHPQSESLMIEFQFMASHQELSLLQTKSSISKPLSLMDFMSNIEKTENKESTSSTKKFKTNTLNHMSLLNTVLASEIELSHATELKSSLINILIEISAISELPSKTLREETKDLLSALQLSKEIMTLKFNPKEMLLAH